MYKRKNGRIIYVLLSFLIRILLLLSIIVKALTKGCGEMSVLINQLKEKEERFYMAHFLFYKI